MSLTRDELQQATESLTDWRIEGYSVVREVSVSDQDTGILANSLRTAAMERGRLVDLIVKPGSVVIRLGVPNADQSDIELAAELDAVISGSAPTPGTQ